MGRRTVLQLSRAWAEASGPLLGGYNITIYSPSLFQAPCGQQGQTDTARGRSSLLVTEVSNTQAAHPVLSSYRVEVRHIQRSQHTAAQHSSHCFTPWPSDPRPGWLSELLESTLSSQDWPRSSECGRGDAAQSTSGPSPQAMYLLTILQAQLLSSSKNRKGKNTSVSLALQT